MKENHMSHWLKAVLLGAAFVSLQACAPASPSAYSQVDVSKAFETSDVMHFKPYTRTIFSSNDF